MSGERSGSQLSRGAAGVEHATILLPSGWPRPQGYSNGVAANGRVVAISGQIGWNPIKQRVENDDLTLQVRQALVNIEAILRSAGAIPSDVIRMTWFVTDREAYIRSRKEIGRVYREIFGKHYPAMSVIIVAGLLDPRAKVEIETTAVIGLWAKESSR